MNRAHGLHSQRFRLPDRPGDEPVCRDCVYHEHTGSQATQCTHPECSMFDRIEGRLSVTPEDARNKGHCGMSGKFFERKPGPNWLERNFHHILGCVIVAMVVGFFLRQFFK